MLTALGDRLARVFRASAPDPFVLAILLTLITYVWALLATPSRPLALLDMWQGGFWDFLAFAMQMCLILVTGHALAASPPVARLLRALTSKPRTGRQAVWMTSFVAICFGLVNWGFGLIVGAVLARDVGAQMRAKGVRVPTGLLPAAGYTCMLCWHGGMSGSAPLKVVQEADLVEVLGADLAAAVGSMPVTQTLLSSMNLVTTGGLLVLIPLLMAAMCPRRDAAQGSTDSAASAERAETPAHDAPKVEDDRAGVVPEFLERSFLTAALLGAPALVWLAMRFADAGAAALDLNTANLLFLASGLLLHGSVRSYAGAVEDGARGCAGIIVQFPLYAGIIGIMKSSGLAAQVSGAFAAAAGGSQAGLSVMTFLSAGLVNLFVPSGGGQWGVQGPIAMQAAIDAGVEPSRLVLAVAYGDQWTNMLQPFWALPLLALTGVQAREIVGYTAVALLAGGAWMIACLALL